MDAKLKRMVPAGQFKDRCLALMDEVAQSGAELVITKHGRPVVRIMPADAVDDSTAPIFGCLAGSVTYNEPDINAPVDEVWDADRD
jgi:prevent-host-death family protein